MQIRPWPTLVLVLTATALALIVAVTVLGVKLKDTSQCVSYPAAQQFPQLTLEQAKAALMEAIAVFEEDENKARLEALLAQANAAPPEQQGMMKMTLLMPAVQEIQTPIMAKYGFEGPGAVMAATMQIQMLAPQDPEIQNGVMKLMGALSGNI